jgi:glycosyltransferase involved in cell wall biosynthesis
MKIALITHHFPPNFRAGGEQYAFRLAQGLHQRGLTVEVVTIESITQGELRPRCETDDQYGFPVHRLFFSLQHAPNQYEWSFRNPQLGDWVKQYLQQGQPDLVHVNSGYLLGGTVPEAAFALGLPTLLTLHDYWFICPEITLLQRNGRICHEPVPATACVWCALSTKRRYRLPDQWLNGRVADAFVALNEISLFPPLPGVTARQDLVQERRRYLGQVFARFDRVISPSRFLLEKMAAYGLPIHHALHIPVGLDDTHLPVAAAASTHPLRIGYLGQIAVSYTHLTLPTKA